MKRFLILGAGSANKYTLQSMFSMEGVEFIVFDGDSNSIAKDMNCIFECIDISNTKLVLERAKQYELAGVFSINDHGLVASSLVSQTLRLKGLSLPVAHSCIDKGYMRTMWRVADVVQPCFEIIRSRDEIKSFAESYGYPLIIKPVNAGGGSRGVCLIENEAMIDGIFAKVSDFLNKSLDIIIEQYIEGRQITCEVVKIRDEVRLVAYGYCERGENNGQVTTYIAYPGDFPDGIVEKIKNYSKKAMNALGIESSVAHIEYILTADDELYILELGARAGGGHIFSPIVSLVSGLDYPKFVVDFCSGNMAFPVLSYSGYACYYFLMSVRKGVLTSLQGVEEAGTVPGVRLIDIWKKTGSVLQGLENSMDRIGCIVAKGNSQEEAIASAKKAKELISFKIEQIK